VLKADDQGREGIVAYLQQHMAELSLFDALAYYYAAVVEHAQGVSTRSLPCPFADQGLLLNPDGSLQYCHNSQPIGNALEKSSSELYYGRENLSYRSKVRQESCPGCQMSCLFFVSLRKELFPFLSFIIKRLLGIHRLHWRKPKKLQTAAERV